jgi:hypothetical protein
MEASNGGIHRDWRQCWKLRPEDVRWLRGSGDVAYGRKIGFALAVAAAVTAITTSVFPGVAAGFVSGVDPRAGLAAAGLFAVLGVLVRQGKGWASLALMALFTAYMVIPNLAACLMPDIHFAKHPAFWTGRVIVCGGGWGLWMRVFWLTYQAERRQAALTPGMGS